MDAKQTWRRILMLTAAWPLAMPAAAESFVRNPTQVYRMPPVEQTAAPAAPAYAYAYTTTSAPTASPSPVVTPGNPAYGNQIVWSTSGSSLTEAGRTYRVGDDLRPGPITDGTATFTEATSEATLDTSVEGVGFHHSCTCGVCAECCAVADCCPPPCCPTYWIAGVEATFLAPNLDGGEVNYLLEDTIAAPAVSEGFGSDNADLDNLYIAPRLWVGVQRGCWGIVARYWRLDSNNQAYDPYVFAPGAAEGISDLGYFTFNQLDMYTADIEGTYSFCCCNVKNTLSFGARYASAEHTTGLDTIGDVNDGAAGTGVISGGAYARRSADGTGLTGSWYSRKPLFPCSCINVIGGLRGSVLWGDAIAISETRVAAQTPSGGGAISTNSAFLAEDGAMFIGEAQLGLQWDYRVQCFPADAFFRIMAEYQYWNAGDGTTLATSFAGFGAAPNFSQGTASATADSLDIDLYGLSVGTGFTW